MGEGRRRSLTLGKRRAKVGNVNGKQFHQLRREKNAGRGSEQCGTLKQSLLMAPGSLTGLDLPRAPSN